MPRYLPLLIAVATFAAPVTPAPISAAGEATPLRGTAAFLAIKADDGLFHLTATRAGGAVEMIVDTGATQTILTQRHARRLGLDGDDGELIELQTANGTATMRRTEVDGLVVAGKRLPPLQVAVAESGLAHSLLGQDALAALGRITIERDRLAIGGERP